MRKPPQRDSHYSKSQSFYTQDSNNSNSKCPICSQQHFLWQCKHFQNLSPKDRSKVVMTNKYCLNCLSKGHFISKCPSKRLCKNCNRKHHTMLHIDKEDTIELSQQQKNINKNTAHYSNQPMWKSVLSFQLPSAQPFFQLHQSILLMPVKIS